MGRQVDQRGLLPDHRAHRDGQAPDFTPAEAKAEQAGAWTPENQD